MFNRDWAWVHPQVAVQSRSHSQICQKAQTLWVGKTASLLHPAQKCSTLIFRWVPVGYLRVANFSRCPAALKHFTIKIFPKLSEHLRTSAKSGRITLDCFLISFFFFSTVKRDYFLSSDQFNQRPDSMQQASLTLLSSVFTCLRSFLHTCVQYQAQTWEEYPGKISGQYCVPLSFGCALSQADNDHVKSFSLIFELAEYYNGHFKIWVRFLISMLGIISLRVTKHCHRLPRQVVESPS